MKINQLDLFSGIGGFHLGFEKAGYKVTSYFSEIDKHAVAVYKNKFKNSNYVGSVTDVRGAELPKIDLVTFGSPCQDFSLAGKRKGMEGDRSSLILEAIRLIGECRPRVFIWENVKGTFSSNSGEDFSAIIQAFANIGGYRLEWQLLNTSWFLPQNRERIYLVGYSTEPKRDWRGVFPIGEDNSRTTSAEVKQIGTKLDSNGGTQPYQQDRVYDADGIVPALNQGKSDLIVAMRGRYNEDGSTSQRLELNTSGKSNTLTAVQKDNMLIQVKSATSSGYEEATSGDTINFSQPNSETRRGRVGKQKAQTLETSCNQAVVQPNYKYEAANKLVRRNTLTEGEVKGLDFYNQSVRDVIPTLTDPKHNSQGLFDGFRIRRLTPIECERLQGFPDQHTAYGNYDGEVKPMSNSQRYRQCGNAVTVDVVEAIANKIKPLFK
jgi:DNA (cytosine-5)-methyltransferase 1